ncbi:MAG: hypothetical protein WD023_01350, partial [Ilumatobacteraceae bacterium]
MSAVAALAVVLAVVLGTAGVSRGASRGGAAPPLVAARDPRPGRRRERMLDDAFPDALDLFVV